MPRCRASLLCLLALALTGQAEEAPFRAGHRLRLSADGVEFLLAAVPGGQVRLGSRAPGGGLPNPLHKRDVKGCWMGVQEVTVAQYGAYLRTLPPVRQGTHPQFTGRGRALRPRPGLAGYAVSSVSAGEARAFCAWLSATWSRVVRLPDEASWETAARGGIDGARYPWGWNHPRGRALYAAPAPAPPCRFDPNPYGLFDMAGGLWEWCGTEEPKPVARGGAWPERSEAMLRVATRIPFNDDYRDADTGFRILVER